MPQRPKDHVRHAIVMAATQELSARGLEGTTLAGIARRASVSVGNVYKYYPDKHALFRAAVPPDLVARLLSLLRRRVTSLGTARDVRGLGTEHPYRQASEALLALTVEHRAELLFLLRHGGGTEHEAFAEQVVTLLTGMALRHARRAWPGGRVTAGLRRAVQRCYRAWLFAVADLLDGERGEPALREAVDHLTTYHLAGLQALLAPAASRRTT